LVPILGVDHLKKEKNNEKITSRTIPRISRN
jgi:hypothetical protein